MVKKEINTRISINQDQVYMNPNISYKMTKYLKIEIFSF